MARPWCRAAALATLIFTTGSSVVAQQLDVPRSTVPSAMPRIGTIDQRYQAYNIEMVEVTGGKFWKPYSSLSSSVQRKSGAEGGDTPVGIDSEFFRVSSADQPKQPTAASIGSRVKSYLSSGERDMGKFHIPRVLR